jgi:hypothetical protein
MATVPDSTDPSGTRRPNEPLQDHGGTHFKPLEHPDRAPVITCSTPKDALALFELFFTEDMWQLLVTNTNKNAHKERPDRGSKARIWYDTTVSEIYSYLAIRIYMGLHPENQVGDYWKPSKNRLSPRHDIIRAAMSVNRFEQLQRYFHISDPDKDGPAHTKVLESAILKQNDINNMK